MTRLYTISGCNNAERKADVVFIHGLGGDAYSTWHHGKDESTSWPQWIGEEFPEIGVWSLGYAASPTKWTRFLGWFSYRWREAGSSMALPDRALQILDLMAQNDLGRRPLLFICHSLGGLVAKQILRKSHDAEGTPKYKCVSTQTRAVLFLATPHSGTSLASFLNAFRTLFGATVSIEDLCAHDAHLRDLFDWYRNHSVSLGIKTFSYYEKLSVKGVLPIVNPTSAHPGIGADPVGLDEDHLSIAKPRDREAQVYLAARNLILATSGSTEQLSVFDSGLHSLSESPYTDKKKIFTALIPGTDTRLIGRRSEIHSLDSSLADPDIFIFQIVAMGGVGKTALMNHWLNKLSKQKYEPISRVFCWSFYNQGVLNSGQNSTDAFFTKAFDFFGDPSFTSASQWEKGIRLAELVREKSTLIVLDGIEPLQNLTDPNYGKLRDRGILYLLKELSRKLNGLCVITTRVELSDLNFAIDCTVRKLDLDNLTDEHGAELLTNLGVTGTDQEKRGCSHELHGHALSLTLLGKYLSTVFLGDIARRSEIYNKGISETSMARFNKIMESYVLWMDRRAELEVLSLVGFFDRPVSEDAFNAVWAPPCIPGINDKLSEVSRDEWKYILHTLIELKLLTPFNPEEGFRIDCHPYIRRYFANKLEKSNPAGWVEGNKRLFVYYQNLPKKEFTDSYLEMEPLYQATAFACRAGLHEQAWNDVYWRRIMRGDQHYSFQLGYFGSDLSALSNFLGPNWKEPDARIKPELAAFMQNLAGYCLMSLGRLNDALPILKICQNILQEGDIRRAASNARVLNQACISLGLIGEAIEYAKAALELAKKSIDLPDLLLSFYYITLSYTLWQSGDYRSSDHYLYLAENHNDSSKTFIPTLNTLYDYQFCEMLFVRARVKEAHERAENVILRSEQKKGWLLENALAKLTIGKIEATQHQDSAITFLDAATQGLREVGMMHHLPLALLARSSYNIARKRYEDAQRDLREVFEIASNSDMRLHLCDYHIQQADISLQLNCIEEAQNALLNATDYITNTSYHKNDSVIRSLQEKYESMDCENGARKAD